MCKAGFRKHVIPTQACAVAWDLCFLKPINYSPTLTFIPSE